MATMIRPSEEAGIAWRVVAQAFTRPVLAHVAQSGSSARVRRLLAAAGISEAARGSLPEALAAAFDGLKKHYRCEYVYKAILNDRIVFGRHSPRTASLHVELPVSGSIVDLAVVNGASTAYEIKTELDGHRRLESQTEAYLKVFERVYLVTHPRLVSRYAAMTDTRVGILSLTERGSLSEERPALDNGDQLSSGHLFRLLRASEYRLVLERHFGPQGSVPNGRQFGHFEKLWAKLSLSEAARLVREALRARTTGAETAAFLRELPPSWRVLGYATPLSNVQRARVLNALV